MVHIRLQRLPAGRRGKRLYAPENIAKPVSTFDLGLSKQIDTFGGKKNILPDSDQRFEAKTNKISHFVSPAAMYKQG
jgi:hypothetical protein